MKLYTIEHAIGNFGSAIGRGLLAGIAGTVAITIAQMIEMKITGRGPSSAPAEVGGKVLGVEPRRAERGEAKKHKETSVKQLNKKKFGQLMHWGYGTGWGVCRGLLSMTGLKGPAASAIHFGAIWGTELVMIPNMTKSPPATEWGPQALAKDALLHMIYAAAAGAAFDAIDR